MRIVRYTLPIVDYQQLQPLWPGHILSVGATPPYDDAGRERALFGDPDRYRIDMWAMDNDAMRRGAAPPILGVWIVGTGNPMPDGMITDGTVFHGTVDHRPHGGAWHVFSAVIGTADDPPPAGVGEVSTVDDMVERIKARHAGRRTNG